MAIVDLKPRQGNVDLVVEVIEKEDAREFNKFGKTGKVCNAVVQDETGKVKLTLWNDDCDKVNIGDKVHIINGWVGEYQGEMQLTTGKFGKMEIVGKAEGVPAPKKQEEETTSEDSNINEENLEEF